MSSIFFGEMTDISAIDSFVVGSIVTILTTGLIALWQSTKVRKAQERIKTLARHYELRTFLLNIGAIFSGGDKRIEQTEVRRMEFFNKLDEYQNEYEEIKLLDDIINLIREHPEIIGTNSHHCRKCHLIVDAITKFVNDSEYQNPKHHYDYKEFETDIFVLKKPLNSSNN